jgi:hypothetical protein
MPLTHLPPLMMSGRQSEIARPIGRQRYIGEMRAGGLPTQIEPVRSPPKRTAFA